VTNPTPTHIRVIADGSEIHVPDPPIPTSIHVTANGVEITTSTKPKPKETHMSTHHNFTGAVLNGEHKRKIATITSSNPAVILKNLEALGLLGDTREAQKLIASGQMTLAAVGEQKQFYEYEVSAALQNFDLAPADRIAFKINLERAGLMKSNPR
jgi:hypothetical protein